MNTLLNSLRSRAHRKKLKLSAKTHPNGWVGCTLYEYDGNVDAWVPVEEMWNVRPHCLSLESVANILADR